jgi:hypothetical protein
MRVTKPEKVLGHEATQITIPMERSTQEKQTHTTVDLGKNS